MSKQYPQALLIARHFDYPYRVKLFAKEPVHVDAPYHDF